jgi:hypothetical protein
MTHETIALIPCALLSLKGFRFTSRAFLIISNNSLPWTTVALLLAKPLSKFRDTILWCRVGIPYPYPERIWDAKVQTLVLY